MSDTLLPHRELHFPTQRPGEHVMLLLRRHWLILFRNIFYFLILIAIPPSIILGVYAFTEFRVVAGTPSAVLVIEVFSLYYLFALQSYFRSFIDYHLDIWVVTDQRVVSIEQVGLFQRVISELNILKVQDVTSEVRGIIHTFFDYGQVYIQTAGKEERFIFEQVAHPAWVEKIILQVHDKAAKLEELEQVRESELYRHKIDSELAGGKRITNAEQELRADSQDSPTGGKTEL